MPKSRDIWTIYKVAAEAILLGTVEAADKRAAIKKAAEEFKTEAGGYTRCSGDDEMRRTNRPDDARQHAQPRRALAFRDLPTADSGHMETYPECLK
jgi:hypothetical protein